MQRKTSSGKTVKLKAEVAKWNEYKEKVLQWQCRAELARHAKIAEIEMNRGDVTDRHVDTRLPCSEIATESALGAHLQSCA